MAVNVYKITVIGGKAYIGVAADPEARLHKHWRADSYVGRALRKHGLLSHGILSTHDTDAEAKAEEVRVIAGLGTRWPIGYNLTDGGDGLTNPSEELRAHLSQKTRELYKDPKYKANMAQRRREQWKDPATKAKHSVSQKARWANPEKRASYSKSQKDRYKDPEALAKQQAIMANAGKARWAKYKTKREQT